MSRSIVKSLAAADPNVAAVAALIGDPVRAAILFALLDGQAQPASELALRSGASPQAASAHLAKLVGGNLIGATALGRQRLFRLASPEVSHAMEALAAIARPTRVVALSQSTAMNRIREARSCYDHLAGRLGVAVTDRLIAHRVIRPSPDGFDVTASGERFFAELRLDVGRARALKRSFARSCTDWTERRPHLAGSLGAALLTHFLSERWVTRNGNDRALRVTPEGRSALARIFGIRLDS